MKLIVEEQRENVKAVSLQEDDDGVSVLVDDYYIVTLLNDGTVVRHGELPDDWQVDDRGYVIVEDE